MPGYDSWKTRSPDDDLGDEHPSPEQERVDWEDQMQQRGKKLTITCDHCESEIDIAKDPRCVVYDPSGSTDVMCAECRERAWERWEHGQSGWEDMPEYQMVAYRIKQGWRA